MDTDSEWEKWGALDPYFGVITNPEFRRANLGDLAKRRFFESGKEHVAHVLRVCRERIEKTFAPKRVLDFGCGVGRVTFAFAEFSDIAIGIDVSDSMLREAESNRVERGIDNVKFVRSSDDLAMPDGVYDLIHSFIVFQHLEVIRGRRIFGRLIEFLAPGGIFIAHFTYAKARHTDTFGRSPTEASAQTEVAAESGGDPIMLMNPYELNDLLFLMQSAGIDNYFCEFTDHGGELGVLLYFQRQR